jgi:hypothetical protein
MVELIEDNPEIEADIGLESKIESMEDSGEGISLELSLIYSGALCICDNKYCWSFVSSPGFQHVSHQASTLHCN